MPGALPGGRSKAHRAFYRRPRCQRQRLMGRDQDKRTVDRRGRGDFHDQIRRIMQGVCPLHDVPAGHITKVNQRQIGQGGLAHLEGKTALNLAAAPVVRLEHDHVAPGLIVGGAPS